MLCAGIFSAAAKDSNAQERFVVRDGGCEQISDRQNEAGAIPGDKWNAQTPAADGGQQE